MDDDRINRGASNNPDPTVGLRRALPIIVANHACTKDPDGIGELMRAVYGYQGQPATEAALKLAAFLFALVSCARRMAGVFPDVDSTQICISLICVMGAGSARDTSLGWSR